MVINQNYLLIINQQREEGYGEKERIIKKKVSVKNVFTRCLNMFSNTS